MILGLYQQFNTYHAFFHNIEEKTVCLLLFSYILGVRKEGELNLFCFVCEEEPSRH